MSRADGSGALSPGGSGAREVRCRHCGALNPTTADACWICLRRDWAPELSDIATRHYPPPARDTSAEPLPEPLGRPKIIPPERRDPIPIPAKSLSRILLALVIASVFMSLIQHAPLLAFILLFLFLPAIVRTARDEPRAGSAQGAGVLRAVKTFASVAVGLVVAVVVLVIAAITALASIIFGAGGMLP